MAITFALVLVLNTGGATEQAVKTQDKMACV